MAHINELFDFTVSAIIVFENKVLLIYHKKLNMWLQPGGHIELDENPIDALWREIGEETGYSSGDLTFIEPHKDALPPATTTDNLLPPTWLNVHGYGDSSHHHIDMRYVLIASHMEVTLEAAAHHDIKWFTLDEMKRNTIETDLIECARIAIGLSNSKKDDA